MKTFKEHLNEDVHAKGSNLPSNLAMCGYITNKIYKFIIKSQYKYEYWPVIGQNGAKESDKVMFRWGKVSEEGGNQTLSGIPIQGAYKGKTFTYKLVPDNYRVSKGELKKNRLVD